MPHPPPPILRPTSHQGERNEEPPSLGNYYVHETVGQGSFGKVKRGTHKDTNEPVAIKILNRKKLQSANMDKKIRREIHILSLFRHPNICRLYEVIQTEGDIFLIMEHVNGGELYDYIVKKGKLNEKDARYVFQQIVCALEYCHHFRVVHRDLKPENILLGPNLQVKLIDFGLSNLMRDGAFLATSCGSPNYAAPEVISGKLYCGPEVDVWSCGVVLYALLCGCLPFDEDTVPMLFKKIKEGNYEVPAHLSVGARNLVSYLLAVDPLQRQTIPQIRDDEWFNTDLPPHLAYRDTLYSEKDRIVPEIVKQAAKAINVGENGLRSQVERKEGNGYVAYQILADVHRQMQIAQRTQFPKTVDVFEPSSDDLMDMNATIGCPTACERELNLGLVLSITPAMEYLLCQSNSKENKPFYNLATYAPTSILQGSGLGADSVDIRDPREGSRFSLAHPSKSNSGPMHSSQQSGIEGSSLRLVASQYTHGQAQGYVGGSPGSNPCAGPDNGPRIGSVARTNVMYSEAERIATLDANAGWRVGLMADGGSQSIMEALYTILKANDIEWKVLAPYRIAARVTRSVKRSKRDATGAIDSKDLTSVGVTGSSGSGVKSSVSRMRQPPSMLVPENLLLMVYVLRLHEKHDRGFIVDFSVQQGHPILGMELVKAIMEALLDRLN